MIRLLMEACRTLALLMVFGITLMLLSGGVSQLYLDWENFNRGDLDGLIPSFHEIEIAWEIHQTTILEHHIPSTLWATLTGLAIGIAVGLILAAVMDLVPILRWILYPLLILSQTIPIFAIAIVLILLFGFGYGPKIVIVALFCFFPITINTLAGLRSVDHVHTKLLKSFGANPLQVWWKVRLPSAMPAFFSGLRIATAYSVVGAVIGEYVGAGDGLGKFLQRSYQSFKTDQVFLTVIIIAVLSMILVGFVMLVELLALRWRYAGHYRRNLMSILKIRGGSIMKSFAKLLIVLSLLFPLTALAQDGGEKPDPLGGATEFARLEERTSVSLMLDWTPNTNHIGFFVAQALGYYDEANLDVEILEPTDLLPEAALEADLVDFGIGFQDFSSPYFAEGADLVSIAAIIQHNTSGFVALAENYTLSTPADLATLTYGGFGLQDLENAVLRTLLACEGVEWNEANYLDVGFVDAIELMRRDRIDFAWIFYGWQGINAELNGIQLSRIMLADYAKCMPDYYTPILLTSGQMIEERPEVVQAFTHATARGYAYAIQNPETAALLFLEAVPELDEELVIMSTLWLAEQYQADAPRWGHQKTEVWETFTQFLLDNDIIGQAFDTNAVFTNEFLPGTVEED